MNKYHNSIKETFLSNIKNHSLNIIKDDGVHRHIRLSDGGSQCMQFDLITWPGYLCYTGDMGTYVFRRISDMFAFFRMDKGIPDESLKINPNYWGEKLESIGTNAGYTEFDKEKFIERVTEFYNNHIESSPEHTEKLWEEINDCILNPAEEGEHDAYIAIRDYFSSFGLELQDFFDGGGTEKYTFRYIWCLYAIVWGIKQYDNSF